MRLTAQQATKLIKDGRITVEDAVRQPVEMDFPPVNNKPPFITRKYRNHPCVVNGHRFDSKLEAKVYRRLVDTYGEASVVRQVSIPIGELRVRPDFLVVHELFDDGTFRGELIDAKGLLTQAARAKYNHLKSAHGLEIRMVKK